MATVAVVAAVIGAVPQSAVAANCADVAGYGSVTLELPLLPRRGVYTVWTRMSVPDAQRSSYLLEINGRDCYEIAPEQHIEPGAWVWTAIPKGSAGRLAYDFQHSEGNRVRLIGHAAGVKIDRLVLTRDDCLPEGLGDNCSAGGSMTVPLSAIIDVPPPAAEVHGSDVLLFPAAAEPDVTSVDYIVDGRLVQTGPKRAFDSTLVPNGRHAVTARMQYSDGTLRHYASVVTVANRETLLSPVWRWLRYNASVLRLTAITAAAILLVLIALTLLRLRYLKKRQAEFHGF